MAPAGRDPGHSGLAGPRRPQPLPRARAPGGRHPHPATRPLAGRAGGRRRSKPSRRRCTRAAAPRSRGVRPPPGRAQRGPRRGLEPAALPLAALLAARAAADRPSRSCPRLRDGSCGVCEVLRQEQLEIALRGDVTAFAAPAGRAPYELVIAPRKHAAEPSEADLVDAALLLRDAIRRLRETEGPVPLNAWLHTGGALAPRARAQADRLRGPRARRGDLRQLAPPGGGRAAPQGVGSAPSLPFSSRKRRAASIAAPRFRPLSFACLISITVSTASMS